MLRSQLLATNIRNSVVACVRNNAPFSFRNITTLEGPACVTSLERSHMKRSLYLARMSLAAGDIPVGAIVVRDSDNMILGEGFNSREKYQQPSNHAEMMALEEASAMIGSWRANAAGAVTLYTTLEPCVMCYGAAVLARVDRIVYGASSKKFGVYSLGIAEVSDARVNHSPTVLAGVAYDHSQALLKTFFSDLRNGSR